VHQQQQIGLIELVDAVAANPNDRERLYALATRADELAQALRAQAPSEGRWSYERAHTVRMLEDILYRLRELP
jgi:predicted kinase